MILNSIESDFPRLLKNKKSIEICDDDTSDLSLKALDLSIKEKVSYLITLLSTINMIYRIIIKVHINIYFFKLHGVDY